MRWLIPILKALAWHRRVIPDRLNPDAPYLIRHYLLGGENHKWFCLVLHEFMCSDPTDLHDHPFPFWSWILSGSYREWTEWGDFLRLPGDFLYRWPRFRHRIELPALRTEPTFTLVLLGPRTRDWGFVKLGRWIQHDRYFDLLKKKAANGSRI